MREPNQLKPLTHSLARRVIVDVWAVGCILAELIGRKPLFPGKDCEFCPLYPLHPFPLLCADFFFASFCVSDIHQMNLIFATLGTPSDDDMKSISNEKALEYIKTLKKQKKVPFRQIFPKTNPLALDLLEKMLEFNPSKRISVEEALNHPYLARLHHPASEVPPLPSPPLPLLHSTHVLSPPQTTSKSQFDFEFEKVDMTKAVLRGMQLTRRAHSTAVQSRASSFSLLRLLLCRIHVGRDQALPPGHTRQARALASERARATALGSGEEVGSRRRRRRRSGAGRGSARGRTGRCGPGSRQIKPPPHPRTHLSRIPT
jgi:serine/threonine protein kinase